MEIQEAIEKLKEFCKLKAFCELYPDACQKDKCEIYMAIEALSEPLRQGQQDDLIKRQAAIDSLDEQIKLCDKALASFDISMKDEYAIKVERASLVAYRKILECLPSAQPYTEEEIQAMQDLEQAQLDKVYQIGVEEGLQSAQLERKKGKWVEKEKGIHVTSYRCSECGRTVMDDTGYDVSVDYPFCNCGADMRTKEADYDYERAVEQLEHDMLYEPTFNKDDGSM